MSRRWLLAAVLLRVAPPFCQRPLWRLQARSVGLRASFRELPLSAELRAAVGKLGYERLTEVQEETFTAIQRGEDLVVRAQTGSGKTMSFLLPSMDRRSDT